VANANRTIIDADADVIDDENDAPVEEEATEPETEELAAPALQHAVWCISLNMGSCNGCDQQIQALLAPRYQLGRRGVTFAASPRHADIVLLTGVLTHRSLEPVRRVLAQIPDPHAIIAVGDCVIDGSVFAGSPEIIPDVADLLGVNVEIAGNPPTPSQILRAIEEASRLLDAVATSAPDENEADADDLNDENMADEEVVEEEKS
jgi:membrane-bound hydrogenase subunit mbhJ